MSVDPLVTHLTPKNRGEGSPWLFAGICQLWIWLNAIAAAAFRFWVVDRFNYTTIFERKFWPCMFLLESTVQLTVALIVCLSLSGMPRDRDFRVFTAGTMFAFLVNAIIVVAWALFLFDEYRLAITFALLGTYLSIPAILFALYSAMVKPSLVSLWVYAVNVTLALKCFAIILPSSRSDLAVISYPVITLVALGSVILPLRFGLATSQDRVNQPGR